MAFIISSLIVLAVWLFGMFQLQRIFSSTALASDGTSAVIDSGNYDDATLLGITEAFISCRTRLKDKLQPVTLQLLYDDIP